MESGTLLLLHTRMHLPHALEIRLRSAPYPDLEGEGRTAVSLSAVMSRMLTKLSHDVRPVPALPGSSIRSITRAG